MPQYMYTLEERNEYAAKETNIYLVRIRELNEQLASSKDAITRLSRMVAAGEREEPVVWVATLGYSRWCIVDEEDGHELCFSRWCIVDEEDGHELCFIGATYAARFNQAMSKSGITVREWTAPQPEPAKCDKCGSVL